ncbi:MAG: hypothetical protein Q9162_003061 [Coniocarpon cinnabarinum]
MTGPPTRLLVTVNSTGRQAASVVRAAAAVGWQVRAQLHSKEDVVASELEDLENVTLIEGSLEDPQLVGRLFENAELAFVNTYHWGDEVGIGCRLGDAARDAGVKHYVYSSMVDHSAFNGAWKAIPFWASKHKVEGYLRSLRGLNSTFVFAGCYNNNFTSLRYPLFGLELQANGGFVWQAPFPPDAPIPWLDPEHDMGPALLQIFKEGPRRWAGHRIPITFEVLTPLETCEAFSRGLGRKVTYRRGPIEFHVPVPDGYRAHLETMQEVLGDQGAPYFGPDMYYPQEAITLWEGNRGIEEYAHEIFPGEEEANGLTWMLDDDGSPEATAEVYENGVTNGVVDGNAVDAVREEKRAEAEQNYTDSAGL